VRQRRSESRHCGSDGKGESTREAVQYSRKMRRTSQTSFGVNCRKNHFSTQEKHAPRLESNFQLFIESGDQRIWPEEHELDESTEIRK